MKKLLLILFILSCSIVFSQETSTLTNIQFKKRWFASAAFGTQMSGIKSEDFIGHNFVPSFSFSIGTWFTPEIALQISYKGLYFNTISDDFKHHYNFFFGEVLLNINEFLNGTRLNDKRWNAIFHPGAGIFYNKHYNRPNICANLGLMNTYGISKRFDLFLDVSAVFGYDIYQGDDDILPSIGVGLTYDL